MFTNIRIRNKTTHLSLSNLIGQSRFGFPLKNTKIDSRLRGNDRRESFTLIELLVVLALVAILSVVVILTLNPAELIKQARDSNRLSDLPQLTPHSICFPQTSRPDLWVRPP